MRRALVAVVLAAFAAASCDEAPRRAMTPDAFLASLQRTLDPKSPGPAELPSDLLPMPFPWIHWTAIAAAAAVGATLLVRNRRRRPIDSSTPVAAVAAGPAPHETALRRLAELRARRPMSAVDVHVAAATIVRDYVGERFAIPTTQMTSEQIVATTAAAQRSTLSGVFVRCDGVKFARETPNADDADRLLASAEAFVTSTSGAGGAA
jgi:hypothetical protein